ncbi:MAG: acetate/propionate family kinase [Candidatus Hodarchaeales archaeon]
MLLLTINSGSSSLKYSLYEVESFKLLTLGRVERIGLINPKIFYKEDDQEIKKEIQCNDHREALELILKLLMSSEKPLIRTLSDVYAVVHRVVHGGERFMEDTIINDEVESIIEKLSVLAPLHNPPNLQGIQACRKLLPKVPHVAVFDTAFHNTIPDYAFRYAIPSEWYDKKKFRRYGFHGTSVEYVSQRAIHLLGVQNSSRIIVLHLGNGASITAVRDGRSVDTSMGLTPLEGLIMGTRSGDLDPGLILAMIRTKKLTVDQLDHLLNKESGLLGVTGKFRDMRDIEASAKSGDPLALLTLEMASYRIKKYIGAYYTILGGLDAIIFTAGIGEKSSYFRAMIMDGLEVLGALLDKKKNNEVVTRDEETSISRSDSKVDILVIPTNEELMMAQKAFNLIKNNES